MNLRLRNFLFITILFTFVGEISAQTNTCSGSVSANTLTNYATYTQIGNGTPGYIQICITGISLQTCMGANPSDYVILSNTGAGANVIWSASTANGTCYTFPSATGFGYAAFMENCGLTTGTATLTWTTVDAFGNDVCIETCDDGIQNQDETGVDCGGTFCVPCSCTNGIQDPGETGIDCGGACGPCGDCYDGIQNGAETGVDCGGPTCLPCSTNSTLGNTTNCCTTTTAYPVYPTNCDQIGTSAYNLNSPIVETTGQSSGGCLPSPSPTGCGAVSGLGSWTQLSLENGVTQIQSSWAQGGNDGIAAGNSTTYSALYQGNGCGSLSYVDCQPIVDFSASGYYVYQAVWTGLDPNQDVWIYTWNNNGKNFNLDLQYIGVATPPTNTACPGSTALGEACNLGATGASFNTPGSQGVACAGGNWGSNENTTFYSFLADATTGSLEIQNITCNDGSNGNAQFAVWTSCAAIGTYGSGFLGCAVGTATISLSPLVPGQTYYIAADGFAGDNCAWEFTGTGILLPIELASFEGYHNGHDVELYWSTASEDNNNYFTVQRTLDGRTFEDIGIVSGAGTSHETNYYSFFDNNPYKVTAYYRIKQTDFDGKNKHTELVTIKTGKSDLELVRTINLMGQEVTPSFHGMVIDVYSDGSSVKRLQ